jgi:hypothetical protein
MKTVAQIIEKIDRQYTNGRSNADKYAWINDAVTRLYKDIGLVDIIEIETTEDVFMYALDASISFQKIRSVTVSTDVEGGVNPPSQITYRPVGPDDELYGNCYFKVMEGYIGIYPTPTINDQIIRINYTGRALVVDATTDNVEVDQDYYEAIEYYVLMLMAESNDDIVKFNNFLSTYNSEIMRIKREMAMKDGKYPKTQDVNRKPCGAARRRAYLNKGGRYLDV